MTLDAYVALWPERLGEAARSRVHAQHLPAAPVGGTVPLAQAA